ncbi:MAG: hypothetical protein KKF46_00330 [Nanoarchaeota archaeon]|nr:hypothetical protein [Nanoarchaeota archaeon]MBU1320780.1 hypothetical protein [Nanoarchaeota archaeon]MBU1598147.1 hypothetical protein [Nanoarchaeota archaeon]MBU2442208.1 hypothetical protein [Nanoarchaeota archaeon]
MEEGYIANRLEEKIRIVEANRGAKNKILYKTAKIITRLQKHDVKTEENYKFKYTILNKLAAGTHNIPIRFAQANAGVLPTCMQKIISDYRNQLGVEETPNDYVKYSIRLSYPVAFLKVASGLGLLTIPFLAPAGDLIIGWGLYLMAIDNPIRHYLRKKGKPKGVFIPYQMFNPVIQWVINKNGKRKDNNTEKSELLEEKLKE